jgi:hypothetical protein
MNTKYKGQEVEVEIQFEPCVEDSFLVSGTYVDSGVELSEAELEELQGYLDLSEEHFQHFLGRAEYMGDD